MKIAIYQVNVDRDDNQVCFCGRKELEARQGTDQIDASLYDKVWEGEMACYTLDGVYCKCNTDPPLNYKAREMSVSDVVEVCDDDGPEPKGFYFCDTNEFTEIPFDKEQTMDARPPTMEVVLVDPGKAPQVVEIGKTYDDLHRVIGGYLECVDLEPNVCLICDEEGKMKEREPNRALYDGDGDVMDVVFGRFFLCRLSDGSCFRHLWIQAQQRQLRIILGIFFCLNV